MPLNSIVLPILILLLYLDHQQSIGNLGVVIWHTRHLGTVQSGSSLGVFMLLLLSEGQDRWNLSGKVGLVA